MMNNYYYWSGFALEIKFKIKFKIFCRIAPNNFKYNFKNNFERSDQRLHQPYLFDVSCVRVELVPCRI